MSIAAANIRTAIAEVLQGSLGSVRTVTANAFRAGAFDGQPDGALQAKTAITTYSHRFDVRVTALSTHAATPASIKASHRVARAAIEIPIYSHIKSTAQDSERATQREKIENDCDTAIQALTYPGNLTQTAAAGATGIVSGMLFGPDGSGLPQWSVVSEDWELRVLRSVIKASAALVVTQATS